MITKRPSVLRARSAFTLIELLVVIAIIGILVSLLGSAVMKGLSRIPEVQASTEMSSMGSGLAAFNSDYQLTDPPPSWLILVEDRNAWFNTYGSPSSGVQAAYQNSFTFLKRMLGKNFPGVNARTAAAKPPLGWDDWNGNGQVDAPMTLQGQQCLVFYLGGLPTYSTSGGRLTIGMVGFSLNNLDPTAPVQNAAGLSTTRRGPYFPFVNSRLGVVQNAAGLPISYPFYQDPYQIKNVNQVYAFFSTQGRANAYIPTDCAAIGANPYWNGAGASGKNWLNNSSYQLICAGADGKFGSGNMATAPSERPGGRDDQSNFSSVILGAGQQ
ncbi:MAG TPA: type II secretion system protein [Gemmataceae bacterium]|jgi:prepilin-type N-terminal cleavage/methylation domain-containing protein